MMEKLSLSAKKISLLLLTFLFLFTGCSRRSGAPDFRSSAFCAELVYLTEDTRICAVAKVGAPHENSKLPRDATLSFTAPEALCGLTVTRANGEILYEYKGLTRRVENTGLFRCIDLLLAESPDTTEDPNYDICFSESTGYPEQIITSNETLQIQKFQKISSEE